MGRQRRKTVQGSDFHVGGTPAPVPASPNDGVGSEGNQNTPGQEFIDRVPPDGDGPVPVKQFGWTNTSKPPSPEPPIVNAGSYPSDAGKHDPNLAHRIRK